MKYLTYLGAFIASLLIATATQAATVSKADYAPKGDAYFNISGHFDLHDCYCVEGYFQGEILTHEPGVKKDYEVHALAYLSSHGNVSKSYSFNRNYNPSYDFSVHDATSLIAEIGHAYGIWDAILPYVHISRYDDYGVEGKFYIEGKDLHYGLEKISYFVCGHGDNGVARASDDGGNCITERLPKYGAFGAHVALISEVPVPASLPLLAFGVLGFAGLRRMRKAKT